MKRYIGSIKRSITRLEEFANLEEQEQDIERKRGIRWVMKKESNLLLKRVAKLWWKLRFGRRTS